MEYLTSYISFMDMDLDFTRKHNLINREVLIMLLLNYLRFFLVFEVF